MNLSTFYVNAYMAGLISKDQQNTPPEEVEVRGDLASLIQFTDLMFREKECEENYEALRRKFENLKGESDD